MECSPVIASTNEHCQMPVILLHAGMSAGIIWMGQGQRTMIHVLLLWQVGFFEVIIRQTGGKLHQRRAAILVQVGMICLPLRVVGVAFGRLWVRVRRGKMGRGRRRRGIIGLVGMMVGMRIGVGIRIEIGIGIGIKE